MAIPLTINGVTFQYPQQFDLNWGPTLTNWSQAVTSGMLQKAGGSFTLTSEVDFGGSFGLKSLYFKSHESNIAGTGILRLANASTGVVWRNAANSTDLTLTVNSSNQLTFNGTSIGATTSLTNTHILVGNVSNQPADVVMSGDTTITNAGVVTIANSAITDAKVSASAAITLSKLAPTTAYYWYIANTSGVLMPLAVTASRAVVTDSNGSPTASATTATELGYVSGVTSALQIQINGKVAKTGDTMSGPLNMGSNKVVSVTQGSSTGEAISFPVNTAQISANAVTQFQQSSADNFSDNTSATVTSVTITTTGGPVLLLYRTVMVPVLNGAHLWAVEIGVRLSTGTTCFIGSHIFTQVINGGAAGTLQPAIPITGQYIDSPVAGTYTYQLRAGDSNGTVNVQAYSLQAIEFKK